MLVQIIAEGPTDRIILKSLLKKMSFNDLKFIKESKTQMKRRGKNSILFNYNILAKFLHHGFSSSAEIIVICVDNDNERLDNSGIGLKIKLELKGLFEKFLKNNKFVYQQINPKLVFAVPVQTIDYWMKCIDENKNDCNKIRKIENISKGNIKIETYGKSNVYGGWAINQESMKSKINQINRDPSILRKLRCLPSFGDFEVQLEKAVK